MEYFNKRLEEYLNKKQDEIVKLIKPIDPEPPPPKTELKGNQAILGAIDWSDKIVDAPMRFSRATYDGEIVNISESHKNNEYGFDEIGFLEVTKLAKQIYKSKTVNQYVSYNTILNTILDWFFEKYKNHDLKSTLCEFITNKLEKSIKAYNVYFPVVFLDIDNPLRIGPYYWTF